MISPGVVSIQKGREHFNAEDELLERTSRQRLVALIDEILIKLSTVQNGIRQTARVELNALSVNEQRVLLNLLGRGEVTVEQGGQEPQSCYETHVASVWFCDDQQNGRLELGTVPECVWHHLNQSAQEYTYPQQESAGLPVGAQQLLQRLQGRYATRNRSNTVINLTHSGLFAHDLAQLRHIIQPCDMTIHQQGACLCKMQATRFHRLWWVQFTSGQSNTMVEVLEIGELPQWFQINPDDLDRSHQRLRDIATWISTDDKH